MDVRILFPGLSDCRAGGIRLCGGVLRDHLGKHESPDTRHIEQANPGLLTLNPQDTSLDQSIVKEVVGCSSFNSKAPLDVRRAAKLPLCIFEVARRYRSVCFCHMNQGLSLFQLLNLYSCLCSEPCNESRSVLLGLKFITHGKLASLLGVDRRTIRRWVADPRSRKVLGAVQRGSKWRIPKPASRVTSAILDHLRRELKEVGKRTVLKPQRRRRGIPGQAWIIQSAFLLAHCPLHAELEACPEMESVAGDLNALAKTIPNPMVGAGEILATYRRWLHVQQPALDKDGVESKLKLAGRLWPGKSEWLKASKVYKRAQFLKAWQTTQATGIAQPTAKALCRYMPRQDGRREGISIRMFWYHYRRDYRNLVKVAIASFSSDLPDPTAERIGEGDGYSFNSANKGSESQEEKQLRKLRRDK